MEAEVPECLLSGSWVGKGATLFFHPEFLHACLGLSLVVHPKSASESSVVTNYRYPI